MNGEVYFEKSWNEYVTGFGYTPEIHWVGLEDI